MTTIEIARTLVELCRQGKAEQALDTLYAPDAVSVEAMKMPDFPDQLIGVAAIRAKGQWWRANHEVHSEVISGPWPHGDRFIVGYKYDVTAKPINQRFQMEEAALYTVRDDKIVREEFFYTMDA